MSRWTYSEFRGLFDGLASGGLRGGPRMKTPPNDATVQGLAQPISFGGNLESTGQRPILHVLTFHR